MLVENGEWIMQGLSRRDPKCIRTPQALERYVQEVGFLPLFSNRVPGFSVEEHTAAEGWWSGEKEDPWSWREELTREGKVLYGKFFGKKAGYVSAEWFPAFANLRRDGYDFDALWDDEKASRRQKKIMDLFGEDTEMFSFEVKEAAGFGKGGEKNFEGVITELQMMSYLCVRDFRQKKNRQGQAYGWAVAVYTRPEHLIGYDHVSSCYKETREESEARIIEHLKKCFGAEAERELKRIIG